MGVGAERHDVASYETHTGRWIGFRQPVFRVFAEQQGRDGRAHVGGRTPARSGRRTSSGSTSRGTSTPTARSASASTSSRRRARASRSPIDEYYEQLFRHSVPGLPEAAAAEGLSPLAVHAPPRRVRDARATSTSVHERTVAPRSSATPARCATTTASTACPAPPAATTGSRTSAATCRSSATARSASRSTATSAAGFPTPSRKLELYSDDAARLGLAGVRAADVDPVSHVHWEDLDLAAGERILLPTFRLPDADPHPLRQREVAQRDQPRPSAVDPPVATPSSSASRSTGSCGSRTRIGLVRHPGLAHRGHPARRRRRLPPHGPLAARRRPTGQRGRRARSGSRPGRSGLRRRDGTATRPSGRCASRTAVAPFASDDPDTERVWWTDAGVHQNLTFPVQPDPVSGMHCWLQRVTVGPGAAGRPLRRRRRRHRPLDRGVPGVAGQGPARAWTGRAAASAVAGPPGQAGGDRVPGPGARLTRPVVHTAAGHRSRPPPPEV